MEISINRADIKAKKPTAILKYLYAVAPEKVAKLAGIQGVLIEDMNDAENLGVMIQDKETNFNLKRFVSALRISSKEILASKEKVSIIG